MSRSQSQSFLWDQWEEGHLSPLPFALTHFQEDSGAKQAGEISGNRVTGDRVVSPQPAEVHPEGGADRVMDTRLQTANCDVTLWLSEKFPSFPLNIDWIGE